MDEQIVIWELQIDLHTNGYGVVTSVPVSPKSLVGVTIDNFPEDYRGINIGELIYHPFSIYKEDDRSGNLSINRNIYLNKDSPGIFSIFRKSKQNADLNSTTYQILLFKNNQNVDILSTFKVTTSMVAQSSLLEKVKENITLSLLYAYARFAEITPLDTIVASSSPHNRKYVINNYIKIL